jgi:hypothetical protein
MARVQSPINGYGVMELQTPLLILTWYLIPQERNQSQPVGRQLPPALNGWISTLTNPTTSSLGGQISVVHNQFPDRFSARVTGRFS